MRAKVSAWGMGRPGSSESGDSVAESSVGRFWEPSMPIGVAGEEEEEEEKGEEEAWEEDGELDEEKGGVFVEEGVKMVLAAATRCARTLTPAPSVLGVAATRAE